jgi:hypothetical protein
MSRSVTLRGAAKVMPRWRHSSTSYFGGSNVYFTNSSSAVCEKSEIGNTDLNTACSPPRRAALRLVDHQELVVGRLLNLDEVRHLGHFLILPKNLRMRFDHQRLGHCFDLAPLHG